MIDHLREAGAKVIAIGHPVHAAHGPDRRPGSRRAIERAHGKVVLAATEVAANGETKVFGGNQVLNELGARAAYSGLTLDTDGEVRRLSYAKNGLRTSRW